MEKINLERSAISITQRCTLKCKLCNAYMPYYDKPRDMLFEDVEKVLKRYFSIVDTVGIFSVLGGEPLMHKDLGKILRLIGSYGEQILERIDLVTNGTLDMKDDVLGFFIENAPKAKVIISHYGELSAKADMLVEKLERHGVNYRVANYHGDNLLYNGWLDFRDHSKKHFTQEAVEQQAQNCIVRRQRYYLISEGEMHTCTRAHWRMREGIIPKNPNEYLNLLDENASIERQKEILREMDRRIATTSCAHCDGSNENRKRYVPAEQLKKGETINE